MMIWVIVAVLVIIALFILKANHFKHRLWVLILISITIFLILSVTVVYSKYNLEFNSVDSSINSAKIYFGWLANGFTNLKSLTGNAIKMDWTSSNDSILDKKDTGKVNDSIKDNPNVNHKK